MRYHTAALTAGLCLSATSHAQVLETFESFDEGTIGDSFASNGVEFHDANQVSGQYPDGEPFGPGDPGSSFIIEQASLFYNDFPGFGSPVNALTFGRAFIPGDNLTIGPLASVWMSLDENATSVSLDLAYFENGPWGGIEYHLDALLDDAVVGSSSFTIADGGGRDNATWTTMALDGIEFDQLHLYATLNGGFTAPRGMIDDLSLTIVPAPASGVLVFAFAAMSRRRRR